MQPLLQPVTKNPFRFIYYAWVALLFQKRRKLHFPWVLGKTPWPRFKICPTLPAFTHSVIDAIVDTFKPNKAHTDSNFCTPIFALVLSLLPPYQPSSPILTISTPDCAIRSNMPAPPLMYKIKGERVHDWASLPAGKVKVSKSWGLSFVPCPRVKHLYNLSTTINLITTQPRSRLLFSQNWCNMVGSEKLHALDIDIILELYLQLHKQPASKAQPTQQRDRLLPGRKCLVLFPNKRQWILRFYEWLVNSADCGSAAHHWSPFNIEGMPIPGSGREYSKTKITPSGPKARKGCREQLQFLAFWCSRKWVLSQFPDKSFRYSALPAVSTLVRRSNVSPRTPARINREPGVETVI